jgi:hypothetical protein
MEYELKYMLPTGIIDFFHGSIDKNELAANAIRNLYPEEESTLESELRLIETMEEGIKAAILKNRFGRELPHTIRYFSIPNFDNLEMELCAIAKIDNNGQTFLFTNNNKFLKLYSENSFGDIPVLVNINQRGQV